MRRIGHLTPRYIFNRIRWGLHERTHMDEPWLTPGSVKILSTLLLPTDLGIEWGSGRSTRWFSKKLKKLTTVESDAGWLEIVRKQLAEGNIKNVDLQMRAIVPADASAPYIRVVDELADRSLGFALVDGDLREQCVLAVLDKIAPGGVLVIDNAHWFLDRPTKTPANRFGRGPLTDGWAKFETLTAGWRSIWITSGVDDTGIWIKPC